MAQLCYFWHNMARLLDKQPPPSTFENKGKWICRYGIREGAKWKERRKTFATQDEAEVYRERRSREYSASAEPLIRMAMNGGEEGVKFGDVVEGKNGSMTDDWRALLWQATLLMAITPFDEDLRSRCKVISTLAAQARKFIGDGSSDQPVSEISQEAMLENMLKIADQTASRMSKEQRDRILGVWRNGKQ